MDVDCRLTWVRSHFEASHLYGHPFPGHRFGMRMCEVYICNETGTESRTLSEMLLLSNPVLECALLAGLAAAYHGATNFARDGLLFLHGDSPYIMGNSTTNPLALRWKDASCSRWPVDTDPSGNMQPCQHVVRSNLKVWWNRSLEK